MDREDWAAHVIRWHSFKFRYVRPVRRDRDCTHRSLIRPLFSRFMHVRLVRLDKYPRPSLLMLLQLLRFRFLIPVRLDRH